jgi:CheY-like chemotaxis protein/two-component sensor histidine kinase
VQRIVRNSELLLTLISDIIDLAKIESKQLPLVYGKQKLSVLIAEMQQYALDETSRLNKMGIEIITDPLADDCEIETDVIRISQVMKNLVNNAIKFTEKGHVYINVSIKNIDNADCIVFDVEDTGIGIEFDRQEEIFNSFSQADSSTSRNFGGTGLGLTITKQLAELLGGKLLLKSKPQVGSIFTLILPVNINIESQPHIDKYETACEIASEKNEDGSENIFAGRVLVAEDCKTNKYLAKLLLEKLGFEVDLAESGTEAVEKASNTDFDLIFMDIEMPEMNGYDATETLRNNGLDTPIIALTAKALKGDCEKCLQAGCDDYIAKPIDINTLVKVIEKYIGRQSPSSNDCLDVKSQVDELYKLCEQADTNEDSETGNLNTFNRYNDETCK